MEPIGGHQAKIGEIDPAVFVDIARYCLEASSDFGACEPNGIYILRAVAVVLPYDKVAADSRIDLVVRVVGDSELSACSEVVAEYVPVAVAIVLPYDEIAVNIRVFLRRWLDGY